MRTQSLYTFILLLIGMSTYAQITYSNQGLEPPVELEIKENTLQETFSHLDKSKIPHGLLLDAAIEFIDLKKYNGSIPDSSYTSAKAVMDIYHTLLMSRLSETAIFQKTAADFSSDWWKAQQEDVVPLAGLYYQYVQFSQTVQNNAKNTGNPILVDINGSYIEDKYVNGVWQNPYEEEQVFAMAPAINTFNKLNFNIALPQGLLLSNAAQQIQKIEYRLADNLSYQVLPKNQLIPVSYSQMGTYHWTFKLTLTNGEILYSHTSFTVEGDMDKYIDATRATSRSNNLDQYTKIPIDPYTLSGVFPWNNDQQKAKATMYIQLANGHQQITKPLIVAEGFDTGRITAPSKEGGDNNIDSFFNYLNGNWTLKNYIKSSYDIIYVDWGNGTDYIQNNAQLLKKAINWVNEHKVGNEKNVVLGQSMGGLVARYALKEMEDNGENHDTKLYISHDSPHLGANIPIGLQYMLNNVSRTYIKTPIGGVSEFVVPIFNQGISPNDILTIAGTPAARQMLLQYVNHYDQIDNSIHNAWQNELKSKGFPQQTRNVAISNGSECGTDQNLQELVKINITTGDQHLFSDVVGAVFGGFLGRLDMVVLAILPGRSRYTFDFDVKPMTQINQNKKIYTGRIKYKKKILWLINTHINILKGDKYQPSGVLPYDKYGGGRFELSQNVLNESLPEELQDNVEVNQFSFIPTPSALDIYSGNQNLTEEDYQRSYSPDEDLGISSFENFVAEKVGQNHHHISFGDRNGQFIINQLSDDTALQNEKIASAYLCGDRIKIGGDDIICDDDNQHFYTTGFAPNIYWSIEQGNNLIDVNSPTNEPQISFTPKDGANGLVKLKAYLSGDGASNTTIKNIWIGKPKVNIIPDMNPYDYVEFTVKSMEPNATLEDQGLTENDIIWKSLDLEVNRPEQYDFQYKTSVPNHENIHHVKVRLTNVCGETIVNGEHLFPPTIPECEVYELARVIGDQYTIATVAGPSDCLRLNEMNLFSRTNTREKNRPAINYKIIVSDAMGNIVISKIGKTFNLERLPIGSYFVKIIKDNKVVVSQTLVKK